MKVTGLTSSYLTVLADDTHALNGLVKILSALDPVFKGKNFEYIPQDEELFLNLVSLPAILLVDSQSWISSITGYPWYISTTDKKTILPAYWVRSSKYDEDSDTYSQMTFEEWATANGFVIKEYDDSGTTKYLMGDLTNKMDLSIASTLQSDGWELKSQAEAKAIYSAEGE